MKKSSRKALTLLVCLSLCFRFAPAAFAAEQTGQTEYTDSVVADYALLASDGIEPAEGMEPPMPTEGELEIPPLNYIPSGKTDVPITGPLTQDGRRLLRGVFPSAYNSYAEGNLPPVRDQRPYGSCWTFSTLGAMEADLIADGKADTGIDLSEWHLAYFSYHNFEDDRNCSTGDSVTSFGDTFLAQGGNQLLAYRTLANMVGAAAEADAPYERGGDYTPSLSEGRAFKAAQLTGAYVLNTSDRDAIKAAIMEHGGVSAAMNYQSSGYNSTYNSYYISSGDPNHAIMLVGWDDSFPWNHFAGNERLPETAENNGAWLVRNSWGGDGYNRYAYFWMSYYDAGFLSDSVYVFDAQDWQYDHCYGYDSIPYPSCNSDYAGSSATITQVFHVYGGEQIEAVGINAESTQWDLTISLSCGNMSVTKSYHTGYEGFYLIPLDKPFIVPADADVTLEISVTGADIVVPYEVLGSYWYGDATFHGACGSGGVTINGNYYEQDAWLKLYTMDIDVPEPDLILPTSLTSVGAEAFLGGAFTYAQLSEETALIASRAFADCDELTYIYIPEATESIAEDAFGSNKSVTILGVKDSAAAEFADTYGFPFMEVS